MEQFCGSDPSSAPMDRGRPLPAGEAVGDVGRAIARPAPYGHAMACPYEPAERRPENAAGHSQEWLCHPIPDLPSAPLAVPPPLPRIVIGSWDDKVEQNTDDKRENQARYFLFFESIAKASGFSTGDGVHATRWQAKRNVGRSVSMPEEKSELWPIPVFPLRG